MVVHDDAIEESSVLPGNDPAREGAGGWCSDAASQAKSGQKPARSGWCPDVVLIQRGVLFWCAVPDDDLRSTPEGEEEGVTASFEVSPNL